MSFFSKIIQKTDTKKKVESIFGSVLKGSLLNGRNTTTTPSAAPEEQRAASAYSAPKPAPTPDGRSWGESMPAEENQFQFKESYYLYFEKVFSEDFPGYRLERTVEHQRNRTVFTFWQGYERALVVELLSDRSRSQKLRRDCAALGIPYLRFYHDHPNWWNTRSYVVSRTRAALGM